MCVWMILREYMQIHNADQEHNNLHFKDAFFCFLDPAQRNHGRLDNDGRSCAVRQAPHSPFVSTTMQMKEVGHATENKEDKWAVPKTKSCHWHLLSRLGPFYLHSNSFAFDLLDIDVRHKKKFIAWVHVYHDSHTQCNAMSWGPMQWHDIQWIWCNIEVRVNGICVSTCTYTEPTQNTIIPFTSKFFCSRPSAAQPRPSRQGW